jgi:Sortase domain
VDDEGPASADVIDDGRPPAEPRPRRHVGFGVGVAVAMGVVVAVVGAGTAVGGPGPAPAPVAATSRVLTALDPMPVQVGPAPAAAVLRATAVHLPTLGVDSTLVDLDIGADGVLVPPVDPDVAGWYRRGAAPGEQGPAVIAGHVDSRSGPAVFFRLDELAPGDRVEVDRSDGKAVGYRVVSVESHPKTAFPTALVYGPTPGSVLRLITCGGVFDPDNRHYRDNVVVTAVAAP